VKSLWVIVFGLLAALFAGVFAVAVYATLNDHNVDAPDVAARKASCKELIRHVVEISPQRGDRSVDDVMATIPVEDVEQCGAAYPEVDASKKQAPDVAGVRNCVPKHVECKGPETIVDGDRPVYEITGDCKKIVVRTSSAILLIRSLHEPVIEGAGPGNHIEHIH
jgi:hypothetical protein